LLWPVGYIWVQYSQDDVFIHVLMQALEREENVLAIAICAVRGIHAGVVGLAQRLLCGKKQPVD